MGAALLLALVLSADLLTGIREARGDSIPEDALLSQIAEQRAYQVSICHRVQPFSECHDLAYVQARVPPSWTVGEIIAWNSFPDSIAADAALDGWLRSPGHRAIILGDWDVVGVGSHTLGDRHYFVALFADNGTAPPLSVHRRPERPVRFPRAEAIHALSV